MTPTADLDSYKHVQKYSTEIMSGEDRPSEA